MIRRSWMTGASIERTLELWALSLREVKSRMRPLFAQERAALNAGLFVDGLLGDERRKTGWMRAPGLRTTRPDATRLHRHMSVPVSLYALSKAASSAGVGLPAPVAALTMPLAPAWT